MTVPPSTQVEEIEVSAQPAPTVIAEPVAVPADQPADASEALTHVEAIRTEEPDWRKEITLELQTWSETKALIESFQGQVVVVDIWSTACEPCLREFPNLVSLQEAHPMDVVCIGLNCDYAGVRKKPPEYYRDRVMKVLTGKDARIVNVMCTEPADELFQALKIDSIPAAFVYDRDGRLVRTFDNETNDNGEFTYAADVIPAIMPLIEGEPETLEAASTN